MLGLQGAQLLHEHVELRVGDDGIVEHVVAIFVGLQLTDEPCVAFREIGRVVFGVLAARGLRRHVDDGHFQAASARFQW